MASKEEFQNHVWQDLLTPEIIKIYEPYRRETFVGEKPALLLIDLYKGAYKGGPRPVLELQDTYKKSCGEYAWNAIKPTQDVIALCRQKGIPLIYCTGETRLEARHMQSTKRRGNPKSDDDYAIMDEFKPQFGDIVLPKQRASIFYGTPLAALLVILGVRSLIVVGESTSGCVRSSVIDCRSHGYHTVVVEECVFDRHPLPHKMNLFDMHHKYADVMHVEEVLAHLATLPDADVMIIDHDGK